MARFNIDPNADSTPVLDRVVEAYGFTKKMQLAAHLDMSASGLSSRYSRNGLPADIMVKCMADTGVTLEWLTTGNGDMFAASVDFEITKMKYDKNGAAVIDRVIDAYGFRLKMDLCKHVGIASSTLSTWIKADSAPGSLAIQCALETGVSLEWLVTGEGVKFKHSETDITNIGSYKLINGQLKQSGKMMFDKIFIPNNLKDPCIIQADRETYFVDKSAEQSDGRWLVEIEGNNSIRELAFVPVKKVKVLGGGVPFDCGVDDIKLIARVVAVFSKE